MKISDYSNIENSKIDYKESVEYNKPKSWLKTVSAFANTNGGILIFGVKDKTLEVVGLKDPIRASENISELVNNKIYPLPRYEIDSIKENDKECIVLNIGDGPRTPYYYDSDGRKEAYIRSGNQSIIAPKHILDSLILKGQNTTYDELPSKYSINDLSFTLFNATFKKESHSDLEFPKDYYSMNLLTNDNYVTNAGVLLSDQGLLLQSRIFCTRWNGLIKASLEKDALDDKEYSGSIISLLENAETFIRNNSKVNWQIKGMERIESEDYPNNAVREAIVNAIIHRDYQIMGSEIHIDIFDDRLEITSPGGMVDGSCVQDLDIKNIPSIRRNRVISDIFNRMHYMERRGSGLIRMLDSYKDSKIKPEFYSDHSSFKVTFPNKNFIQSNEDYNIETKQNIINDSDLFFLKLHKNLPSNIRSKTYVQLQELFVSFGFNKEFRREDVSNILKVQKSRAIEIMSLLIDSDLVLQTETNKYKFKK